MAEEHQKGRLYFSLWLFRQLCLGVALGGAIVCGVATFEERREWAAAALVLALYALGMAALTHWALRLSGEKNLKVENTEEEERT